MTSVITATALVVRPPDGTAGSAYREIGRVRSRTSTIRMTNLARFHPPTTTLSCSGSVVLSEGSRNCPAVLGESDFSNSRITPRRHGTNAMVFDRVDEQVGLWERWRFQCRNRRSATDNRWHPVRRVPRRSGFARKQFTLTTARGPAVVSATAAM